jgi:hypothetical protein
LGIASGQGDDYAVSRLVLPLVTVRVLMRVIRTAC